MGGKVARSEGLG